MVGDGNPGAVSPEAATRAYIDGLGPEALEKAAAYTMGGHGLWLVGIIVSIATTWLIVKTGILPTLEQRFGPKSSLGVFLIGVVFLLLDAVLTFPLTLYQAWWRETQYGRTSQPLSDFLGQTAIATVLSALIGAVFFVLVYLLIRRAGRLWWLWSGGMAALFISALMLLLPVYVLPIFNDYEPLPAGEVREALESMAQKAGIPPEKIFVFDGSRQSNNFTANVSGILGTARIAISDVALGEASLDEVKAVTGHEIGHFVLGHVWRAVGLMAVLSAVLFFLADRMFGLIAALFGARRSISDPSGMPVLALMAGVFFQLALPLTNALSRAGEMEADAYSLEHVQLPDALAAALVKTAEYRDPRPYAWQELIFYTHPTVERRVRNAMEWKRAHESSGPSGD